MILTPPDDEDIDSNKYGLSNDFMMAPTVQDVADHPAVNLPIQHPKLKKVKKKNV